MAGEKKKNNTSESIRSHGDGQVPCTDGRFSVSQQTLAEDGTPPRACLVGRFAIAALHGTHSMFLLKSVPGRHNSQTRVVAGRPGTRP